MSIRLLARAAAGLSLCAALSAYAAGPYSGLVVFGDSLSDSGNNATLIAGKLGGVPQLPITGDGYYSKMPSLANTYSDGMVWTQYFAESLGLTLAPSVLGGSNYAFGGAQTGIDGDEPLALGFPFSMRTQLGMYMDDVGKKIDPNALYVVAGGGNNVRAALEAIAAGADPATTGAAMVAGYAEDMASIVGGLKQAGARHVLVMNTPNFGLTPLAHAMGVGSEATALSFQMNVALGAALAGSGVSTFDMFGFMTSVVAAGPASGFTNWTNACGAAVNNCDLATALFWDGIHPTTVAHQQLAAAVLATAVPEPESALLFVVGLAALALGRRHRAALQQR